MRAAEEQKKIDLYYQLLDNASNARAQKDEMTALACYRATIPLLRALVHQTTEEYGSFDLSLPTITVGARLMAVSGDEASLQSLRAEVMRIEELACWIDDVNQSIEDIAFAQQIVAVASEQPGVLQKDLHKHIATQQKRLGNLCHWLERVDRIQREKSGSSNAIYATAAQASGQKPAPVHSAPRGTQTSRRPQTMRPTAQNVCPKCGYAMSEFDTECLRCKRMGATHAHQQHTSQPSPVTPPGVCPVCALPLYANETFCPRCMHPVAAMNTESPLPREWFWINLDALRPIEMFLWIHRGEKITDAQLQKQMEEAGLKVEDHPAFRMVMVWPERGEVICCNHSSHNTPEKRAKCLARQTARVAIKTIRHHLGFLERLDFWAQPNSLMRHAMWTCIERHRPACELCRQREGIVIPVTTRAVPVFHPRCNCSLVQLLAGQETGTIANSVNHLVEKHPERARTMLQNAERSGFAIKSSSGGIGCAALVLMLMSGALSLTLLSLCFQ